MFVQLTALQLVVHILPHKDKLRWHRVSRYWKAFIEDDHSWPESQRNALRQALTDTCENCAYGVPHEPHQITEMNILWNYEQSHMTPREIVGISRHGVRIALLKESPAWYLALRYQFEEYLLSKKKRQGVREADAVLLGWTKYKGKSWKFGGLQLYLDDQCEYFEVITKEIVTRIRNLSRINLENGPPSKRTCCPHAQKS
jgi:hypothetical protein